ncbi:MAG: N-acetyl-D-Glu racemase DgcA [Hyphomicrobium sp.]|nr:N-acetyl-D-Glu racemase DgcA [Hyphomicrobium sp.]
MPPHLRIDVAIESWPLASPFVISRGAKTEARVVVVTISDGPHTGRGECVPYARYGETPEATADTIRRTPIPSTRAALAETLPPGAARNALDCALWDLEAKRSGRTAFEIAGLDRLQPCVTCYTLSLGTQEAMAAAATAVPDLPLLKLKLGGEGDGERMAAVRRARPDARLVADANEAWTPAMLPSLLAAARDAGFELVEQPLPAGNDAALATVPHLIPVCADESAHTSADIPRLANLYDAVNIKLDKTGGLTEALAMANAAREQGLAIMCGSMVSTSLATAPALLVAQTAEWVDLDGPLLLARDREHGLNIERGVITPPSRALWG